MEPVRRKPDYTRARTKPKEYRQAARWVKTEGIKVTDAMRELGYAESTVQAKNGAFRNNPHFKNEIKRLDAVIAEAARKHGVTVDRLVQKVSEALDAPREVNISEIVKTKHGREALIKTIEKADYKTQAIWWDKAAQLLGIKKEDLHVGSINLTQINQMIAQAEQERGLPPTMTQ